MKSADEDSSGEEMDEHSQKLWGAGSTFRDLQVLNLAFIRGILSAPYCCGKGLDDESNIIIDQLNMMNSLDMITTDSQPYTEFTVGVEINEIVKIRQRPFVQFYFPNEKASKLMKELNKIKSSAVAIKFQFDNNTYEIYGLKEQVPIKCGRIPAGQKLKETGWKDYYGTSIPLNMTEGYVSDYIWTFGENFKKLIIEDLSTITIIDMKFSNSIFDELITIGKSLL